MPYKILNIRLNNYLKSYSSKFGIATYTSKIDDAKQFKNATEGNAYIRGFSPKKKKELVLMQIKPVKM